MISTLRFLVAFQAVVFLMCAFFAYRVASFQSLNAKDIELFQQGVTDVRTQDEWNKIGNLMVDAIAKRASAYDSLRSKSRDFFVALGVSMFCNAVLSYQILRRFRFAGYEDPSVVLRRF